MLTTQPVLLAGLQLEHPLIIGAGLIKTFEDVAAFARSSAAALVLGTITVQPRPVYDEPSWYQDPAGQFGLNSRGLPNPGRRYWTVARLSEAVALAHTAGKLFILNIVGFRPGEWQCLAEIGAQAGVDIIEVNAGCPCLVENGRRERLVGYDTIALDQVLDETMIALGGRQAPGRPRLSCKLPPLLDPYQQADIAAVAGGWVDLVVASNTWGGGIYFQQGRPVLGPPRQPRYGGVSGPAVLPGNLGQVGQLRHLLPNRLPIIGSGGVTTGAALLQYLQAGAAAVQATSAFLMQPGGGLHCYDRILAEALAASAASSAPT